MSARFFVDENDLALGKALAVAQDGVVYPGQADSGLAHMVLRGRPATSTAFPTVRERTSWRNDDDLVFTSPLGKPTDPKAVRNEFQRVIARAGLDERWSPNLLRHTAASLTADAGMPIEQVADQLGHRDLRMLQRHYRHRLRPTINGGQILGSTLNEQTT